MASGPPAEMQEGLQEPLLPVTSGVVPGQKVIPVIRVVEEGTSSSRRATSILLSTVILSKTILGAGMAALPKSFALLGLGCATCFLLLMAFMTHFSIEAMIIGSLATGSLSYPAVVRDLLGSAGSVVLELCLISRCAGLMIVYLIVAADILSGHRGGGLPGLLCEWFGSAAEDGWCSDRPLAAGVVALAVLTPMVSFRRLSSTAITSWLGLFSVGIWGTVTIALAITAAAKGQAHHVYWGPNWAALGDSAPKIATQLLAVIPVIATAYTCQMTVHHIMREMRPFTQTRMNLASGAAVTLCTVLFLAVAIGSCVAFGSGVPADVLESFSHSTLAPLVGDALAPVLFSVVKLAFLCSILANYPMQMWPYRESFSRLCFGRELDGLPFYLLTYISLAAFWGIAMVAGSIWVPIQIVGATAGALIAFFFPALVALKACDNQEGWGSHTSTAYWRWNAWALIALAIIQAVTGLAAVFIKQPDGGDKGRNGLELGALFSFLPSA